ncbi:MAG TPA: acetyl-CoA carboxylase biotin carboxylase subunit [Gemmataceae bacterium]|nr:acetyl-CoA carboxylase biotin carboxylase subunit [Gemmataceae bacterium]
MFQRILVANRGEIALRVIRACKDLGIEVVAVFSEADRDAPYLKLADEAICIGPAVSTESYLKIPRIISAAEVANVQAIHPGYGFLSENAHFAEVCRASHIEFIGPPEEAMRRLGNKNEARKLAVKSKVPVVPGSEGLVTDEEQALSIAREMGYPVLIKAAAGGGGRGMRVARNDISLQSGLKSAQAEAEAAFKDGSVYIEKYIEQPRHIEVQIIGDRHGNVVHLYERDCSLQRRHQKLVEESPGTNLPESVRDEICASAVRLVKESGYYNAGTCEFLVDKDNRFYFIEVNARIQVEHPVTELVTGTDLVREQIRVAAGEKLSFKQKEIRQHGHAIEVRINAEDPANNFRATPGLITRWIPPGGPGVRLDTHACQGYRVPSNYDSMVAKLLVHQPTRAEAIACMRRALNEFVVEGIKTTIPIHREIMSNNAFLEGRVDTTFIERTWMQTKS